MTLTPEPGLGIQGRRSRRRRPLRQRSVILPAAFDVEVAWSFFRFQQKSLAVRLDVKPKTMRLTLAVDDYWNAIVILTSCRKPLQRTRFVISGWLRGDGVLRLFLLPLCQRVQGNTFVPAFPHFFMQDIFPVIEDSSWSFASSRLRGELGPGLHHEDAKKQKDATRFGRDKADQCSLV